MHNHLLDHNTNLLGVELAAAMEVTPPDVDPHVDVGEPLARQRRARCHVGLRPRVVREYAVARLEEISASGFYPVYGRWDDGQDGQALDSPTRLFWLRNVPGTTFK